MSFAPAGLRALILRAADPNVPMDERLAACGELAKGHPPEDHSRTYAKLLSDPDLSHEARFLLIGVLSVLKDDPSAAALAEAMGDPSMHAWLRMQACRQLVRINVQLARDAAASKAPWLLHLIADEERDPSVRTFQEQSYATGTGDLITEEADYGFAISKMLRVIKGGVR